MSVVAGRPGAMGAGVSATAGLVRPRDPLATVLGESERSSWFYTAAAVAVVLHLLLVGSAAASELLKELRLAVQDNRAKVHDFFWRQYDVEIPKDKPKVEEKAPDPPPEPDPAPPPPAPAPKAAPAPAPKEDDPYKNLPPTPAKAAPVLTQKDDPDEPKDLTNTVVSGDGSATYGQVSAAGTGSAPVMAPKASNSGVPGGKGTAAPVASAPTEDRSRPPGIDGGLNWRGCAFPAEAEAEEINQAVVTLVVTVRPDGSAISATVTNDPGHGFGRAARICALARRYTPGLDRSGQPATMTTPPIRVTFSR